MATVWDTARKELRKKLAPGLSLAQLADNVGRPWKYGAGDKSMEAVLAASWSDLRLSWHMHRWKCKALLSVVQTALNGNVIGVGCRKSARACATATGTPWAPDPHSFASQAEMAAAWDHARAKLLSRPDVNCSVRQFAERVGYFWNYEHGDNLIRSMLQRDWRALRYLPGFGVKSTCMLLDIACAGVDAENGTLAQGAGNGSDNCPISSATATPAAAAPTPPYTGPIAPLLPPPTSADRTELALHDLGIEPDTSVGVLFLSARAKKLLERKKVATIGELVSFLQATDLWSLRSQGGVGNRTVRELSDFLSAMDNRDVARLKNSLPLKRRGYGLSFSAAAAYLLQRQSPENRNALYHRFGERKTYREAAQSAGRTPVYINIVASAFRRDLDRWLSHFSDDKHSLWEAWERCEPMDGILDEDLTAMDKVTVAGAVSKLFAKSDEGKAILDYRTQLFASWWTEICQSSDFYSGGLRIGGFLRDKGYPYLLMPFLDHLEYSHNIVVDRAAGKVTAVIECRGMYKKMILAKLAAKELTVEQASRLLERVLAGQLRP